MPQVFKIAGYWVYFWSNENDPLYAETEHRTVLSVFWEVANNDIPLLKKFCEQKLGES